MTIAESVILIDKLIQEYLKEAPENNLYHPIDYIMNLGGKRLRPALAVIANQYYYGELSHIQQPALGVEVFHNFSLLHDDIMDNAPLRRGKATVHEKWNANSAILSGDAMLVQAYQLVCDTPSPQLTQMLTLFSQTALEVCEGQQLDMDFEKREDVSIEEYIEMITLKTSVLLACSLQMGALSAGATAENASWIYQYGLNMGIAFQLIDDFLDAFGEAAKVGKQVGGDILANKKTFLALKAKELASKDEQELLMNLESETDHQKKVHETLAIFKKLKVDSLIQELSAEYYHKAIEHLNKTNGEPKIKEELLSFSAGLMNREF